MELRHLKYFVAVARDEHFGRAAKRLGVAQSALSRRTRDLEIELGAELFERLPRGVKLSSAGKIFLNEAREVLVQLERAVERVAQFGQARKGMVSLGFNEIASNHRVIARALRAFKAKEPAIRLELLPMSSTAQLQSLSDKTIDAAILYDVHFEPATLDKFHHSVLDRSRILLAIPKSHPLSRKRMLKATHLRNEPILWPRRDGAPRFYDRLLRSCLEAGLPPQIFQETATYSTLLSLVSAGMGIGFVGSEAAAAAYDDVVLRPVSDLHIEFRVVLLWRKDGNSAAVNGFVNFFSNYCAARTGNQA